MTKCAPHNVSSELAAYLTFVPTISNTNDWISLSVIRFIWPFRTWNTRHITINILFLRCANLDPVKSERNSNKQVVAHAQKNNRRADYLLLCAHMWFYTVLSTTNGYIHAEIKRKHVLPFYPIFARACCQCCTKWIKIRFEMCS